MAKAGDLTFAENETFFHKAEQSAAAAILIDGPYASGGKTLIRVAKRTDRFCPRAAIILPGTRVCPWGSFVIDLRVNSGNRSDGAHRTVLRHWGKSQNRPQSRSARRQPYRRQQQHRRRRPTFPNVVLTVKRNRPGRPHPCRRHHWL